MPCTPATVTLTMNNGICGDNPPTYFGTTQTSNPQYLFPNFCSIEVGLQQPVSVFPLPEGEQGGESAIIVKVEGNSQQIRMTWTIKDESAYDMCGARVPACDFDTANGTVINMCGQTNVSTQFEQLEFWTTTMENRSICQTFQFLICTGVSGEQYLRTVLLRDFKAVISGASPVTWNASIDMIVGQPAVTIDEVDT